MRPPWTIQQIEPEVWAIVDADGEPVLTLDGWEYAEGEMVVDTVNGLVEVVTQLLMVDEHRPSEGDPPARDEWEELVVEAREAWAKARGEGDR